MKHIFSITLAVVLFCIVNVSSVQAQQDVEATIQAYLETNAKALNLQKEDVREWTITDHYRTERTGIQHVHIAQTINGIPVKNGVANVTLTAGGNVLGLGNRLIGQLDSKVGARQASITPAQAIQAAAGVLGLDGSGADQLLSQEGARKYEFAAGNLAQRPIKVELLYWAEGESVQLVWAVSIDQNDGQHWYQMYMDATSGQEVSRVDWVVHCDIPEHNHAARQPAFDLEPALPMAPPVPPAGIGTYNVFPLPIESPSHGNRVLLTCPWDTASSPYGWHDDDGAPGAEYTITRGNNVHAYTDTTDNNNPDFEPDGGALLDFDFPLNLTQNPGGYKDVAVANLFVICNQIHDWLHVYGFDEQSGNFQENNYGNGGLGSDYVRAEAQDGGGTNNANFATPDDGNNPRMQMYIWDAPASPPGQLVTVNAPGGLAGLYVGYPSNFGAPITFNPFTADLALVNDGVLPDTLDACQAIINGPSLNGKIAVIRRGLCNLSNTVLMAQNEGAIGVIMVNNSSAAPIGMNANNPSIVIPSVMIENIPGQMIIDSLIAGVNVNASLTLPPGYGFDRDGDFDNGIILHEYGHGVSNRLTGGPGNSGCLSGDEQMGEGWSDYLGIALTMDSNLPNQVHRPMAGYALSELPYLGQGLRDAPYDTSFAVNPYTYGDLPTRAIPHGVGFVWATMLWDLHWAFIEQYGFDSDLVYGTGGNNICFQLVMDGMKLQPCGPGFVDGRDAILMADQINNGGANQCLIWEVFAKRGLGASADQGSSGSANDGVEAFDIPLLCQIPTTRPTSDFTSDVVTTCDGVVNFIDQSYDVPQTWDWQFGDGGTSTLQNPQHIYQNAGTYEVTLAVSNTFGGDTLVQTAYINVVFPGTPTTTDGSGCTSDSILLTATGANTIVWFDANGNEVYTGSNFYAPPTSGTTTYFARDGIVYPTSFVGPSDNSFGGGGNHATNFTGTVNFTADVALTIKSAWVESGAAGVRTINLWDASDGNGNLVQSLNVDVPFTGPGRIELGFEVPSSGNYSIGLNQADLYRNNDGANYPYTVPGLISLTGSPAGTDFYYYLYDLEVARTPCFGDSVPAVATVTDSIDFSTAINNLTVDFTDLSPSANSWAWDFGDGNTSTQQNPAHTFATGGTFIVTLTIDGGLCSITDTLNLIGVGVDEGAVAGVNMALYPNPAQTQTTVALNSPLTNAATVHLFGVDGRIVRTAVLPAGQQSFVLPLNGLSSGIYWLRLEHAEGKLQRKLVVTAK